MSDVAWFDVRDQNCHPTLITGLGKILDVRPPQLNEEVVFKGGTSHKVQKGVIVDIGTDYLREEKDNIGWSGWTAGLRVVATGEAGDSGSFLLASDGKVVGIVTSGPPLHATFLYACLVPPNI